MKRILVAAALASLAVTAYADNALQEHRGSTKIHLYGSIVGETCTISGAKFDGKWEFGFPLPVVSSSTLATPGSTAGERSNTFYMNGCPAGTIVRWEQYGSEVDSSTGALKNSAVDGSNVQVQIVDAQGTPINVNNDPGKTLSGGAEDLSYSFRYLAKTVPVTGGDVDVTAVVSIYY